MATWTWFSNLHIGTNESSKDKAGRFLLPANTERFNNRLRTVSAVDVSESKTPRPSKDDILTGTVSEGIIIGSKTGGVPRFRMVVPRDLTPVSPNRKRSEEVRSAISLRLRSSINRTRISGPETDRGAPMESPKHKYE